MWREEKVLLSATCIDVSYDDEETCLLQMQVSIDVKVWIVAYFSTVGCILAYGKLSDVRHVFGCGVACEISHVGTEIASQHSGNLESYVEIGI